MEGGGRGLELGFLLFFLFAGLASLSNVKLVESRSLEALTDQKTYYSPDPHTGSTPAAPKHSHKKPSCKTPSSGGSSSPSHGSGSTPTPSHGSGGYYSPPTTGGGGGSHSSPAIIPPPSTPAVDPPVVPTPSTPSISSPPSPLIPDPNVPPFSPGSCNYWSTHPDAIFAIFGSWGSIGDFFGAACTAAFGKNTSLQDALKNTRADGIGALYREGTAALLNSMACRKYAFTAPDVKHAFAFAVGSGDGAAAAQAEIFRQANEVGLKIH